MKMKITLLLAPLILANCGLIELKKDENKAQIIDPHQLAMRVLSNDSTNIHNLVNQNEKYKTSKIDAEIIDVSKNKLVDGNIDLVKQKKIESQALMFTEIQDYDNAIREFTKLILLNPSATNFNNLGYAYLLRKDYPNSVDAFRKSITLDKNYSKARANLETALNNQKQSTVNTTKSESNFTTEDTSNINATSFDNYFKKDQNSGKSVLQKISQNVFQLITNIKSNKQEEKTNDRSFEFHQPSINSSIYKLEIVNANGKKGSARLFAERISILKSDDIVLTSRKPYEQKTTIRYRSTFYKEAIILMNELDNLPSLVLDDNLPEDISLRLILGRNITSYN